VSDLNKIQTTVPYWYFGS